MSVEKSGEKESGPEKYSEIEKLKVDVDKAINELRGEIEGLKNALVELKASLSEMENPFNLLASLADEDAIKRAAEAARTKVLEKERDESKKTEERKVEKIQLPMEGSEFSEASYDTSIALIKWVWTLLDLGFDVEDVERISRYCEFFGLLPRGSSHYVSAMASAIEKAKALSLSEDVMALSIYGAAKASGVKIELEDITDIVFNALRKLVAKPTEDIGLQGDQK